MSNELAKQENVNQELMEIKEMVDKNVTDFVLEKVQSFQQCGQIFFPHNYSPENALKSAWLVLQETVDKDKQPVLKVCSKPSIANCLLNMVIQGLNPAKHQCYFIAFGKQLTLMRSYFGSMAVAKQFGEIKDITGEVIYEGDKVETEIKHGKTTIKSHTRSFENIDKTKIIGAYATIIYLDNSEESIVMTMDQIRTSWKKSKLNPDDKDSTHSLYTEEMCKRTVINKICKHYINTKDDSNLKLLKKAFETSDEETKEIQVAYEIEENANKELIDITDTTEELPEYSEEIDIDETAASTNENENTNKAEDKPAF